MIIYSTKLWLQTDMNQVLDVISPWVSRKMTRIELARDVDKALYMEKNSFRLAVEEYRETYPRIFALRLSHPDRDPNAAGRTWITEIGLLQNTQHVRQVECTIQLELKFDSPHVPVDIVPSRPYVVQTLLKECYPIQPTAGIGLQRISHENLYELTPELWGRIDDPERFYPIVLISPTRSGDYVIDPEEIQFQLAGLADVVQIMPDANTHDIAEILTDKYAAWQGAINIIFAPSHSQHHSQGIPRHRMLPQELEQLCADSEGEDEPAKKIMAIVSHYASLARRWEFITPEKVAHHRLRQEIARGSAALEDRLEEQTRLVQSLQDTVVALEQDIIETHDKFADVTLENMMLLDERATFEETIRGLQLSLSYQGNAQSNHTDTTQKFREATLAYIQGKQRLLDCLILIQTLFPDRIYVMESAFETAREAREFRLYNKALDLLLRLATDYWLAMKDGNGDTDAFNIFTEKNYAARESERSMTRDNVRALRTFTYKGEDILMQRHLKIGVKNSIGETWRCYFHWDSVDEMIIIGHCGKHLNLK